MKVKVKSADGSTVEGVVESVLDTEDLPEGLFLESEFEPRFNERFARRAKSLEKSALDKALGDEGFRTKALAEWGIDLTKLNDKGDSLTAEKITKLREEWHKGTVEPVIAERDGLKTRLDTLLSQQLDQSILNAAREVGIREEFLKPLTPGSTPMIVSALRNQFGYDEEHNEFFEKDAKRAGEFAFASKPNGDVPYRTVAERLRLFAEDKANAAYLEKQKARGPNLQHPGGSAGGTIVLTAEQASNHELYSKAQAQAAESGGSVVVQQG